MYNYYAKFNEAGERETSIALGVHFDTEAKLQPYLDKGFVPITEEEQKIYSTNEYLRGADGKPQPRPPYVPTLDDLQAQKWEEIKKQRDDLEQSGVPYMGKVLDSDPVSVQRISIAVQAAQAVLSAGQNINFDWTCADNSILTMTAEQVCGIPVALAQYSDSLHRIARNLRGQIDVAKTPEEIEVITWPTEC